MHACATRLWFGSTSVWSFAELQPAAGGGFAAAAACRACRSTRCASGDRRNSAKLRAISSFKATSMARRGAASSAALHASPRSTTFAGHGSALNNAWHSKHCSSGQWSCSQVQMQPDSPVVRLADDAGRDAAGCPGCSCGAGTALRFGCAGAAAAAGPVCTCAPASAAARRRVSVGMCRPPGTSNID